MCLGSNSRITQAGGSVPNIEPTVRAVGGRLIHIWSFLAPFEVVTPAIPMVPLTSEDVVAIAADPAVNVVAALVSTLVLAQNALMYPTAEQKNGSP